MTTLLVVLKIYLLEALYPGLDSDYLTEQIDRWSLPTTINILYKEDYAAYELRIRHGDITYTKLVGYSSVDGLRSLADFKDWAGEHFVPWLKQIFNQRKAKNRILVRKVV